MRCRPNLVSCLSSLLPQYNAGQPAAWSSWCCAFPSTTDNLLTMKPKEPLFPKLLSCGSFMTVRSNNREAPGAGPGSRGGSRTPEVGVGVGVGLGRPGKVRAAPVTGTHSSRTEAWVGLYPEPPEVSGQGFRAGRQASSGHHCTGSPEASSLRSCDIFQRRLHP